MKLFNKTGKQLLDSNNLYVGSLNSTYVDNSTSQLMCKDGTVNYIFEKRNNNYYEIFTNNLIETEESCHHEGYYSSNISQLYLTNIKPIKDVMPNIKERITKDCLLYLFDNIN